jgi:putative membrane protein insertion efficiency factor
MGHCDSPEQLGCHGEIFRSGGRTPQIDSPRGVARGRENTRVAPALRSRSERAGSWLLLLCLRLYQVFLSPLLGGACKFHPSCSNYAYEAVARHGARRGFLLALKRLLRCRPFTRGGFDPVPDRDTLVEPRLQAPGAPFECARATFAAPRASDDEKEPGR